MYDIIRMKNKGDSKGKRNGTDITLNIKEKRKIEILKNRSVGRWS